MPCGLQVLHLKLEPKQCFFPKIWIAFPRTKSKARATMPCKDSLKLRGARFHFWRFAMPQFRGKRNHSGARPGAGAARRCRSCALCRNPARPCRDVHRRRSARPWGGAGAGRCWSHRPQPVVAARVTWSRSAARRRRSCDLWRHPARPCRDVRRRRGARPWGGAGAGRCWSHRPQPVVAARVIWPFAGAARRACALWCSPAGPIRHLRRCRGARPSGRGGRQPMLVASPMIGCSGCTQSRRGAGGIAL
jgi:hypothetical protein